MATSDFLPFANATGANVESQAAYAGSTEQLQGFQPGLAKSANVNKALRQALMIASALAMIAANSGIAMPDDGDFNATIARLGNILRTRLTASKTLYVSTTGNDANDGLTSGTAWATLQHAYDTIQKTYDLAGFTLTVQVADGTYAAGVTAVQPCFGGTPIFQGNTATPSNCLISLTNGFVFSIGAGSTLQVQGFKVTSPGASGIGISCSAFGIAYFKNIDFGACGLGHLSVNGAGQISAIGGYTISGGSPIHANAQEGTISISGLTMTLLGTPAFSSAFVVATACGQVFVYGNTYTGSATGSSWNATLNGVISTQGGALPGTNTGTTSTGGQKA